MQPHTSDHEKHLEATTIHNSFAMASNDVIFLKHQPAEFDAILGSSSSEPRISILADGSLADLPLYHEACVYHLL
jgi:hypothetical protein